jgi:hypothetical protein
MRGLVYSQGHIGYDSPAVPLLIKDEIVPPGWTLHFYNGVTPVRSEWFDIKNRASYVNEPVRYEE